MPTNRKHIPSNHGVLYGYCEGMAQVERACDIGRRDAQGEGAVLRVWNPVLDRETRKLMQIDA